MKNKTLIVIGIVYKEIQEFRYTTLIDYTIDGNNITLVRPDSITKILFQRIDVIKE